MLRAGTFQGLLSAKRLRLYGNNITFIEENAFIGLKILEGLYLNANKLETLNPGNFCGLDSLRRLDLEENHLTSLPEDVFNHLPRPLTLSVAGNPCRVMRCCPLLVEAGGTK